MAEVFRHSLVVRLCHWAIAVGAAGLLFTGVCILDIHPRLYWGEVGNEGMPAVVAVESAGAPQPGAAAPAVLTLGSHHIEVTGLLGVPVDYGADGKYFLAFPMPDSWHFGGLRAWHFALAWVLCLGWLAYLAHALASGRLRRTLLPRREQVGLRAILMDLGEHLRFRRPRGPAALEYNLLQKLSYLGVAFVLIPLLVLTGLTMSNAVTMRFPELYVLFGGRESARTLHALGAALLSLFILVHLVQLLVIGPGNALRMMTTGWLDAAEERP